MPGLIIAASVVAQTRGVGRMHLVGIGVGISDDDVVIIRGVKHLARRAIQQAAKLPDSFGHVPDVEAGDIHLGRAVVAEPDSGSLKPPDAAAAFCWSPAVFPCQEDVIHQFVCGLLDVPPTAGAEISAVII